MIGAMEAVHSGTTTLCDDTNVAPRINQEHVDAVFQAYEDLGIRAYVGPTLFDRPFFRAVPFVDEEFPKDLLAELDGTPMFSSADLLAFAKRTAREHHPNEKRVGYIAAPSAPQRCTEDFTRAVRRMADDMDLPVMMHVQETRMQVVTGQLWHGTTMVEYLDKIGFMKPKTAFIHGIWLTPREIDILARTGVSVQHNPTSNLKVGSGLAPIRALIEGGVNVSMGTDGCGSIEGPDMQNALYLASLLHKLRGDHTGWVGATDSFRFATMGGAKALGREKELGAIEKGRIADLTAYNLHIAAVHAAEQSGASARLRGLPPRGRFRDGRRRGNPRARQAHAGRRGQAARRDRRGARAHRAADHRIREGRRAPAAGLRAHLPPLSGDRDFAGHLPGVDHRVTSRSAADSARRAASRRAG